MFDERFTFLSLRQEAKDSVLRSINYLIDTAELSVKMKMELTGLDACNYAYQQFIQMELMGCIYLRCFPCDSAPTPLIRPQSGVKALVRRYNVKYH